MRAYTPPLASDAPPSLPHHQRLTRVSHLAVAAVAGFGGLNISLGCCEAHSILLSTPLYKCPLTFLLLLLNIHNSVCVYWILKQPLLMTVFPGLVSRHIVTLPQSHFMYTLFFICILLLILSFVMSPISETYLHGDHLMQRGSPNGPLWALVRESALYRAIRSHLRHCVFIAFPVGRKL